MNPSASGLTPVELYRLLHRHRKLWLLPAVAGAAVAAILSLILPREWRSTQGLIVRPDVAGQPDQRLGKFADLSEMKTVQETVLELARSKSVLSAALIEVGPPAKYSGESWPTPRAIVDFRDQLKISPPGGAEFGQTEVFYLSVLDRERERAALLVDAVCNELETRVKELRNDRAQSMVAELSQGVERAEAQLQEAVDELTKFETSVGSELGELRHLVSPIGGQSELAQQVLAIEAELRTNDAERRQNEKLRQLLLAAKEDPQQLVTTPSSLLASQPALERLKAGLIDSQLMTANLQGSRSNAHPLVVASQDTQSQIRAQIHRELPLAISGVELALDIQKQRATALNDQVAEIKQRIARLAGSRASYSTLVSSVENQTRLVDTARKQLTDAYAQQAGSASASLLARIDDVESGVRPEGLGRTMITAAGGVFGLIFGLGVVFLMHGPQPLSADATSAAVPHSQSNSSKPVGMQRPATIAQALRRANATASQPFASKA